MRRQTAPLVDYYSKKGLLKTVAATGEVDAVYSRLKGALGLEQPSQETVAARARSGLDIEPAVLGREDARELARAPT